MDFRNGEVVNIVAPVPFGKREVKPYSLSLIDRKQGLSVQNLRKSYTKPRAFTHGVVYNGQLYGPNAMEMLAEQTSIKVIDGEKRVMLRGDLSLLKKMVPICFDCKPLGDKPIQFGLPPKPAKR